MSDSNAGPVNVTALGCASSAAFIVLFVLCDIVAAVAPDLPATHAWVGLFTTAPAGSVGSFIYGIIANAVFSWIGAIVGGVVYNRVSRRA